MQFFALFILSLIGFVSCTPYSYPSMTKVIGLGPPHISNISNFTYSPNFMAISLHRLPHIDDKFHYTSSTFEMWTPDNKANVEYISSLFFFPCLCGIFGMAAVIGLTLGLAHECKGVHLGPKTEPVREDDESQEEFNQKLYNWSRGIERGRQNWVILFMVSCLIVLISVHIVFVFDVELKHGDSLVQGAMQQIAAINTEISAQVLSIHSGLYETEVFMNSSFGNGCPEAKALTGALIILFPLFVHLANNFSFIPLLFSLQAISRLCTRSY